MELGLLFWPQTPGLLSWGLRFKSCRAAPTSPLGSAATRFRSS
jgi:hypothetical protein